MTDKLSFRQAEMEHRMNHQQSLQQFDEVLSQLSQGRVDFRRTLVQIFVVILVALMSLGVYVHQDSQVRRQQQTLELQRRILDWLTPLDFAQVHQDILSSRSPGTGDWLIHDDTYKSWVMSGRNQTLWLHGIPGAGKTVLASVAVEDLRRNKHTSDVAVSYIYCDYKDEAQHTLQNIVSVIIKDVVRKQSLSADLVEFHNHHQDANIRPTLPELVHILRLEASKLSSVFAVIDAVDELTDNNHVRERLLGLLFDLMPYINIMLTSRPHVDVTKHLPNARRIEVAATKQDIRRYTENRLSSPEFAALVEGRQDLRNRVIEMVTGKSEGM
jgi:hypothetical protein